MRIKSFSMRWRCLISIHSFFSSFSRSWLSTKKTSTFASFVSSSSFFAGYGT